MSELVKVEPAALREMEFSSEQVALIKRTIAPNATDDELRLFLHHAKKSGLDPLAKQIYFQKYGNKATFVVSIDGYRLIAERTLKYAGSDDPVFDEETPPKKATVTVYKMVEGVRCPFTATARWSEYCPGGGRDMMWKKMPHTMLGKCAEGLALRKAFPAELAGIYTKEEMEQAKPPREPAKEIEDPIEDKKKKVIKAFKEIGITEEQIEVFLEKPIASAGVEDMELLRGIYIQQKSQFPKSEGEIK